MLSSCRESDELESYDISSDHRTDLYVQSGDQYKSFVENSFIDVTTEPTTTFSVDADGASYANVRRFIMDENTLPPKDAVRTEELINYFNLDYPYNETQHPISLNGEVASCPWNTDHKLIRIGIKGKPISDSELPASNFVFLIDISGSMSSSDKLELLKSGFIEFANTLKSQDRIAIVTYAGASKVLLESTPGDQKQKITEAISGLVAGGGTAGSEGINTAYEIASNNFIKGGNNRIILGTDGDFNVGISRLDDLINLIEKQRLKGIFLSVLGVGRGNLNDASMESIADHGNGTYEYIDDAEQMKKVFIYEKSKFFTVAKDVKVQITFNASLVKSYRLIGYENRILKNQDFENDSADAGEIGANQNITALYEIVPVKNVNYKSAPTLLINFRYKNPDSEVSQPLYLEVTDQENNFSDASDFMKFTASVASFSMLLRNSEYSGSSSYDNIISWLKEVNLSDPHGFKSEFKDVVNKAKSLQ